MDKKISLHYKEFLDTARAFQKMYEYSFSEVSRCDNTTQDLLHQLELGTYELRGKTATQLANIRKERRTNKDIVSILQPFIELINTETGKAFLRALQQALGSTRKIENNLQTRQYYPRVLKQLAICQKQEGGQNER